MKNVGGEEQTKQLRVADCICLGSNFLGIQILFRKAI